MSLESKSDEEDDRDEVGKGGKALIMQALPGHHKDFGLYPKGRKPHVKD